MIRGTTPTHEFTLSIDTSLLKCIRIIYAQHDKVVFVKETGDCTLDGEVVRVELTQEETLMLDCRTSVQIQIRALTLAGEALASPVMTESVGKCLDNEVIA